MLYRSRAKRGFTLIELLVVIGIIVLLVGILIPVVNKVQKNAQAASSQAELAAISGAIDQYHQINSSYPGPLPNNEIYTKCNSSLKLAQPLRSTRQIAPPN